MNCLTFTGINHGSSNYHSPSIKNHLRPLDNDFSVNSIQRDVRLDNVESHVGKSGDTSNICSIQLPYSQCKREETK